MKKLTFTFLIFSLLGCFQVSWGQTIIVQWNFDASNTTPNVGTGTINLIGGTTATFAAGNPGQAWNTTSYPAQSTASGTAGIEIGFNATGMSNIQLSFDHRASGTASRWAQVDYSLDGGNTWTTGFWNNNGGLTPHDNFYSFSVDFSSVTGMNNNPNVLLRIVSIFSPQAFNQNASLSSATGHFAANTAYMRANSTASNGAFYPPAAGTGTGNYGATGTWRFDNVTVTGTPPTPTTFYNKPTGDFNQVTTWGVNPDGSGAAPASFSDPNQTFIIANGTSHTHVNSWTVSGTGSKIVVGDGTSPVQVSIIGSLSAPEMDIKNNARVDLYTLNIPSFGTLEPNSTVGYVGTIGVLPATYGNLIFEGSGSRTLPDANFTIQGKWVISGNVVTAATTFRTITFNGDTIRLMPGANFQEGYTAPTANTTHRRINIEMSAPVNQYIIADNPVDTLRIGRLISSKTSGGLYLDAHLSLFNRIMLNYSGTATFNDGGRYIIIGDNIEAQGLTSAYNLTGTFEIRRLDGSTSNHNIRSDAANDNPAVCEFNNLIINSPNNVNFRPTNSNAATYTIKGNLSILSSSNLVDLGTNNTIDVLGNMTNTADTLIVYPGGRLKVDGTLTNSGVIELRASAANGAALLRASGNIPNVRVSQHIEGTAGTGKWIHMRMPVNAPLNSIISQQNAIMFIDNTTGSVYSWNAGTAQYDAPTSAASSFTSAPGWVLYVGENSNGTFVSTLPATITTDAGTITDQSSNVQVPLLYNDGQSSPFLSGPVSATQGWNLIANPWPMVFDIAEGELNGSASFGIHVYRDGAYDAYHHVNNTGNSALRYLPLGQAFWVQRASTPATQNFTFNTAGRQFSNSTNLAKPQSQPGEYHFTLRSVNQANGNTIKTYLSARDNANNQFVLHEDVVARRNDNGYHQFYSYQNDVPLSINTQSKLLQGTRLIPLYFEHTEQGIFHIDAIESGEQDEMYTVVLEDRHTNTFTDLYKSGYTFQHHPAIELNRFNLHINATSIGQQERTSEKSSLWTSNGNIFIQSTENVPATLEIIDLTGRVVFSTRQPLAEGINVVAAPALAHGVYVIRLTTAGKSKTLKTIL